MYIQLFEEFSIEKKKRKKKRVSKKDGNISNYEAPKYVVQHAKDDTGFFLVKKEFEKRKRQYTPGISYSFADQA